MRFLNAKQVAAFLEAQESGSQNGAGRQIYYCGDYLSQSHTGGACASGRNIARLLLRDVATVGR